jgi:chorismate mutase
VHSASEIDEQIAHDRDEIDQIDLQIIELLESRIQVSLRIQANRAQSGGPRTVFSREMAILERYQTRLGGTGTTIAMNVLTLCRGAAPTSSAG